MPELIRLPEPQLLFRYGQGVEDPRDGLALFGPLDEGKPYGIRAGVVGTTHGIRKFFEWVEGIQRPIGNIPPRQARPLFPGFEAAFRVPWNAKPVLAMEVDEGELQRAVRVEDSHQRVYGTVDIFERRIRVGAEEDATVDLWFVIVPDDVYKYCRPRSVVEKSVRVPVEYRLSARYARDRRTYTELLPGDDDLAKPYHYSIDFHNQLKARLLRDKILTQVVRESTIAPREYLNRFGQPIRNLEVMQSAIAWTLSTAAFYKAGGRPWKTRSVRDGVCYVGLAFKIDERDPDSRSAASGAQMFLDSGDGIVFRGALGPWYNPRRGDFHLKRGAARELASLVVSAYQEKHGRPPEELFFHGKVRFRDEEWHGFEEAVPRTTRLVGVRIRDANDLKLFRTGDNPILRGLAYIQDDYTAYLWTRGFIPRLQTYPGREVPNALLVEICYGRASIETVLSDTMSLTKLNYNSCMFSHGQPVTLEFADDVGEILTAGPMVGIPPLQFRHYT